MILETFAFTVVGLVALVLAFLGGYAYGYKNALSRQIKRIRHRGADPVRAV